MALVSPAVALDPLATPALGAVLLKTRRPTPRQIAGILASVAGMVLLLAG